MSDDDALAAWTVDLMDRLAIRLASAHLTNPPGDTSRPAKVVADEIHKWVMAMDTEIRAQIYRRKLPPARPGADAVVPNDELAKMIASDTLAGFGGGGGSLN